MNKVFEIVTGKILEALDRGIVPWRRPWKGSDIPRNLISGKSYSGVNIWLLLVASISEGYKSPYWLTFNQCKKLGGTVRKGEKSSLVVFWKPHYAKTIDKKDPETDDIIKEEVTIPVLRYYRVFNADQCEGIETPKEDIPLEDFNPLEAAESIVCSMPNPPKLQHGMARAFYAPSEDRINLPQKESFYSEEEYYSTAFHEFAHSTGHKSRLNRFDSKTFQGNGYSEEELVAEMTAAFLIAESSIETPQTLQNSVSYLDHWRKNISDNPRLIVSTSGKAQRAANYILNKTE